MHHVLTKIDLLKLLPEVSIKYCFHNGLYLYKAYIYICVFMECNCNMDTVIDVLFSPVARGNNNSIEQ